MKAIKLIAAAAATIGVLASCQQREPDALNAGQELVPVNLSASFNEVQTKVSYEEEDTGSNYLLKPVWEEENDRVIGFDDNGNKYTFTVSDVDANGVATLSGYAPASCKLHLIYLYGATAENITGSSMTVSYANQAGDKTMPAVMLADGEVKYGSGDFHFHNAGAVIGIKAVKGVPNGSTISKITISGENLSAGSIALDGSSLKLTATEKSGDSITITSDGLTVTDNNGTLSSPNPILIAVPAEAKIAKVCATTGIKIYSYALAAAETAVAGEYLYVETQEFKVPNINGYEYVEIGNLKWATCNVGADSPQEYGRYFAWGEISGHKLNTEETGFEGGYSFDWEHTPFNDGGHFFNATYFNEHKSEWLDGNDIEGYTLKPENDAAYVNWGGEWRMPTKEDFQKLFEACGGTGNETEPLTLSSATPDKGLYWVSKDQSYIAEYTGVAGVLFCDGNGNMLFFPAAGYGNPSLKDAGSYGFYWSSSFNSSNPTLPHSLVFFDKNVFPQNSSNHFSGQSVRPVSD